jgi:hypothetical protein
MSRISLTPAIRSFAVYDPYFTQTVLEYAAYRTFSTPVVPLKPPYASAVITADPAENRFVTVLKPSVLV